MKLNIFVCLQKRDQVFAAHKRARAKRDPNAAMDQLDQQQNEAIAASNSNSSQNEVLRGPSNVASIRLDIFLRQKRV